jgi:hypothetical protein
MTTCTVLFCILERHEGDEHVDVTGHSWTEATPEHEVLAKVYTFNPPPLDES